MKYFSGVTVFLGLGMFSFASWSVACQDTGFYARSLKEIVGEPTSKKGTYIITLKLDEKIPNDTGRIVFEDGKALDMETVEAGKDQPSTDKIIIYLRGKDPPLQIKNPDDLKAKLPLKVKIFLRRNKPAEK
jgi:hypothetical protein